MKKAFLLTSFIITINLCGAQKPFGPVPSAAQLAWQKMEMNMFCHFGPNTFTGKEWGDGTELEDLFSPTALDCNQWAATAKAAGFKGIIITAKHHDGFCLWPSSYSTHTVAQSAWRDGRGDVLAELSEACREEGLLFGVYISPWDRNHPDYGTAAYNDVFAGTIREVHTAYGPVFEQWFDGAGGQDAKNKGMPYDWARFNATVHEVSPQAVIFSDVGPGCRWVGNERGYAGETNWAMLELDAGNNVKPTGQENGWQWNPGESDAKANDSGWFWNGSGMKSAERLFQMYLETVGRNATLILNCPPDKTGSLPASTVTRLAELGQMMQTRLGNDLAKNAQVTVSEERTAGGARTYAATNLIDGDKDTYWATNDGTNSATIEFTWDNAQDIHYILLQEPIRLGQRVKKFKVEYSTDGTTWKKAGGAIQTTTVGYKRIIPLNGSTSNSYSKSYTAKAVRVTIEDSRSCPALHTISIY